MTTLTIADVEKAADQLAVKLKKAGVKTLIPVPRGGIPAAWAVARALQAIDCQVVVSSANHSKMLPMPGDVVIDDIYDSGRTLQPYMDAGYTCATLAARYRPNYGGGKEPPAALLHHIVVMGDDWLVFPWEESRTGPEDAVARLLEFLGRDPNDESIKDTPRRVVEWLATFKEGQELGSNLTTFDGENYDEMVIVKRVPFVALCEHHLMPFTGQVAVAYIPQARKKRVESESGAAGVHYVDTPAPILGLSKLARITQHVAHRATVQERMTRDIARQVSEAAHTPSVAVLVEAEHTCMTHRGVKASGSLTVTSALLGAFRNQETRAEFLALAKS